MIDPKSGKPVGDVPLGVQPHRRRRGRRQDLGAERVRHKRRPRSIRARSGSSRRSGSTATLTASTPPAARNGWASPEASTRSAATAPRKIALWKPPVGYQGACFTFVTGDGKSVWVSEGQDVAVLDAASGNVLRKLRLPAATGYPPGVTCYGLRYGGGQLLAIRNVDYSIGTVDLGSRSYTPIATDATSIYTQTFGSGNWASGFGYDWLGTWRTVSTDQHPPGLAPEAARPRQRPDHEPDGPRRLGRADRRRPGKRRLGLLGKDQATRLAHVDPTTGQITGTIPLRHQECCPNGAVGSGIAVGHGRALGRTRLPLAAGNEAVRCPVPPTERSVHRYMPVRRRFRWYFDMKRMGGTGLEPVTPSLSSWCSPN